MRCSKMVAAIPLLFAVTAMAQAPAFQPVGSVRQVMLGIVKPTSDVVFKFQFDPPKTDEEWTTLQNNALNLAEAGNLLLIPGRAKDASPESTIAALSAIRRPCHIDRTVAMDSGSPLCSAPE